MLLLFHNETQLSCLFYVMIGYILHTYKLLYLREDLSWLKVIRWISIITLN